MEKIITCPRCGSSQITANKKGFSGKKAVAGAVLTGGIGLLAGTLGSNKVVLTCLACGRKFRPGEGKMKTITTSNENFYQQEKASISNEPEQTYSQRIPTAKSTPEESKNTTMGCLILVIALCVIGFICNKTSCNDDTSSNSTNNVDTTISKQENVILFTHADSIKTKQDLDELLKSINTINVEPRNAIKKFSHYSSGLANYSSDITQVFQAAKAAKQKMEYAEQEISNLNLPNTLLNNQKDSLQEALSTISSSYLTMANAFDEAMQMAQNPTDNSYVEAFQDDMNQATQLYGESLNTILRVQSTYQNLQKTNSKFKHKQSH